MSLYIECTYLSTVSARPPIESAELLWSEILTIPGTTTNSVPSDTQSAPGLMLTAEVDMWVAIGAEPDATKNPRRRLKAGQSRTLGASAGHRVAWSAS